ncbi:hypothetical protein WP50_25580, partial [Lactiplantibacillus plantarum]
YLVVDWSGRTGHVDCSLTDFVVSAFLEEAAIEYVTPAKKYDASLQYRVDQLTKIKGPTTVTVPANGSKLVSAQTTMPTKDFNGALLGGWYFKRVDQKVTGEVKGATNISSEYSYVVGRGGSSTGSQYGHQ